MIMLLLIVKISAVLCVGWVIWKFCKCFVGSDNRHRFFAKLCDKAAYYHNAKTSSMKAKLFEPLNKMKGNIRLLEIGAGSGANLQFYPENTRLTVVDPNPFFRKYLEKNLAKNTHVKLENCVVSGGEDMKEIPDNSIDVVVTTLVQCSVIDMQKVFKEVQRVLKPGGKYYFMEHVIDDKNSLLKFVQMFLSNFGIFPFLFDGCHNNRDVEKEIRKAGFAKVEAKRFRLDLSGGVPLMFLAMYTVVPHLYGVATTA